MGYFTIKAKSNLDEMEIGSKITESDFSILTQKNNFVQMEYHDDEDESPAYDVKNLDNPKSNGKVIPCSNVFC